MQHHVVAVEGDGQLVSRYRALDGVAVERDRYLARAPVFPGPRLRLAVELKRRRAVLRDDELEGDAHVLHELQVLRVIGVVAVGHRHDRPYADRAVRGGRLRRCGALRHVVEVDFVVHDGEPDQAAERHGGKRHQDREDQADERHHECRRLLRGLLAALLLPPVHGKRDDCQHKRNREESEDSCDKRDDCQHERCRRTLFGGCSLRRRIGLAGSIPVCRRAAGGRLVGTRRFVALLLLPIGAVHRLCGRRLEAVCRLHGYGLDVLCRLR